MAEKCLERYFNMPIGNYCGLLLKEDFAKKAQKLLYKHSQELKELLINNLDQLELSNWTLVYPDGKQTSINYFNTASTDEKIERIKLLDKSERIRYCKEGIWKTDLKYNEANNDVIKSFNQYYEKITI
jgi:hypothetical protein